MRLLLLSNSTNAGQTYLEHAIPWITNFLGRDVERVLFVPFAGVTIAWSEYAARVGSAFSEAGYAVDSVHESNDPVAAVRHAQAIAVGGGNTFRLLEQLYAQELVGAISERVRAGAPYLGWSAGSNVACPTIRTTNDMPIVAPPTFEALGLVPFQINPHYTDAHPPGHQGETRADRLAEFVTLNRGTQTVGMPEGTALRIEGRNVMFLGNEPLRLFAADADGTALPADTDLGFLMSS